MAQLINKAQMRPVLWHHLKERKTIFFHQQSNGRKEKKCKPRNSGVYCGNMFFFALLRCLDMTPERFVINKAAPIIDP
jgi:hypothetical protein